MVLFVCTFLLLPVVQSSVAYSRCRIEEQRYFPPVPLPYKTAERKKHTPFLILWSFYTCARHCATWTDAAAHAPRDYAHQLSATLACIEDAAHLHAIDLHLPHHSPSFLVPEQQCCSCSPWWQWLRRLWRTTCTPRLSGG